ncbi:hypothetical protein HMPREF2888_02790 [Corynebacterium sp. HMSC077D03]|nr:hypothetical protein HMPREF2888_02790 [Corynebacterium sp. HMSC077D03]
MLQQTRNYYRLVRDFFFNRNQHCLDQGGGYARGVDAHRSQRNDDHEAISAANNQGGAPFFWD